MMREGNKKEKKKRRNRDHCPEDGQDKKGKDALLLLERMTIRVEWKEYIFPKERSYRRD
jgi:hypothetical protein